MSTQLQIIGSRDILGKTVNAYGDFENPLFLAKDVAEWIEHSNYRMMIEPLDDDEKGVNIVYTPGGPQKSWFLTESGLYEVLFLSRKPIAKEFKRGVKALLHDLRTGRKTTVEGYFPVEGKQIPIPSGKGVESVKITKFGTITVKFCAKSTTEKRPPGRPRKEAETGDGEMSPIQRFVKECCVFDPQNITPSSELYTTWCRWSGTNAGRESFFRQLKTTVNEECAKIDRIQKVVDRIQKRKIWAYQGIRLIALPEPHPPPGSAK